jgi:hypothetical protein
MRGLILILAMGVALSTPAAAKSIKGVELSSADEARVIRQCDVLRFRASASLASDPEEPPAGTIVSDPASYWADGADRTDAMLTRSVNLDTLTLRDCRKAGL